MRERNDCMSDIAVKAVENHRKGYNCAQAVACAFADRLGIDEKEIFKTMELIQNKCV